MQDAFVVAAANLPGNVVTLLFLEKLGRFVPSCRASLAWQRCGHSCLCVRKRTLWVSMTLSSCLAMLFAFSKSAVLIITVASALNCISTCGWNAVCSCSCDVFVVHLLLETCVRVFQLDCLSTESFPTNLRTSGMGILAAFGRIGSVAGQLVFGWLINVSVTVLLVTAACCLFVGTMLVFHYSVQSLCFL